MLPKTNSIIGFQFSDFSDKEVFIIQILICLLLLKTQVILILMNHECLFICKIAKLQVRQIYCIVTWSLLILSSNAWRRSLARWALCILGLSGIWRKHSLRNHNIFVPTLLYHQQYVTGNRRSCNNHINNKKARYLSWDTRLQTKQKCLLCSHTRLARTTLPSCRWMSRRRCCCCCCC